MENRYSLHIMYLDCTIFRVESGVILKRNCIYIRNVIDPNAIKLHFPLKKVLKKELPKGGNKLNS